MYRKHNTDEGEKSIKSFCRQSAKRSVLWIMGTLLAAFGLFFQLTANHPSASAQGGSFFLEVNNTGDAAGVVPLDDGICDAGGGVCTLRAALDEVNGNPNPTAINFVNFNIPGAGPHTIAPATPLPAIGKPVFINGYTEPGASPNTLPPAAGTNAVLMIELDGSLAGPGANGFTILGGKSTVRGLVINRFNANGILLAQRPDNKIGGNYIGTNVAGTVALPNGTVAAGTDGIRVATFTDPTLTVQNLIGGAAPSERNVISGNNDDGIEIGPPSSANMVQGNFIGLASNGAPLGNTGDGVFINDSPANTIGGLATTEAGNFISNNLDDGVDISFTSSTDNIVRGNRIGTNVSGNADFGNGSDGVEIFGGAKRNRIGGSNAGEDNLISGNTVNGVFITGVGADENRVELNLIGANITRSAAIPNGVDGVQIFDGAQKNVVTQNRIEGNARHGVGIISGPMLNEVLGNFIGSSTLPNGADGIHLTNGIVALGATLNQLTGNSIGNNPGNGITITGPSNNNIVTANGILGNNGTGIEVSGGAAGNAIGGTIPAATNFILGNFGPGITIAGGTNTTIRRNTIAYNGSDGVFVGGGPGNSILTNSIFLNGALAPNGGLGIDLFAPADPPNGVTPNDVGDGDTGANNLQNYPVLTSATRASGSLTINGTLSSAANQTYRIEFFSNPIPDPTGFGEGQTFIGTTSITTDAGGNANFSFTATPPTPSCGEFITATATDAGGNTSEFSFRVIASCSPADFDGDGRTDISVFRPTTGAWWVRNSSNDTVSAFPFGTDGDRIAPGDYDGDGRTDYAVFRPSTNTWYIFLSSTGAVQIIVFGFGSDIIAPADYDGDCRTDIAVFRPSTGTWYIRQSSNSEVVILQFGSDGDVPVSSDYDGDGRADITVWRPSNGFWYRRNSSNGQVVFTQFGQSGDKPAPGDYDGDGKADVVVYRPDTGTWFLLQSSAGFTAVMFGASEDRPAPGDYDGDGRTDIAVWRPSTGQWFILLSGGGLIVTPFGMSGDAPVPSAYIPN